MRILPKLLFTLYVLILAWLVLLKSSLDLSSVLAYQTRALNLIPFANSNSSEMISNLVVFIPFGLLLSLNFKQSSLWSKVAFIFVFSLAAEIIQYIWAIGRTDITDVIINTLGGLIGLGLYHVGNKYIDSRKLDKLIVVAGTFLLILFLLLRFLVFRVKY